MAAYFPIDFSQPLNTLGQIGQTERTNGIKINDYKQSANEYSSVCQMVICLVKVLVFS